MKQITQITSQKKQGDRLNVFLDGEFAFGVAYETAVRYGLKVGAALSQETIDAIASEDGEKYAFDRGLKYVVKKKVTERQMRDHLVRVGFSGEATESAIEKLKEYGYIDDGAFCKAYIATYGAERGARRLRAELSKAGVSSETIEAALADFDGGSPCRNCIDKYLRTHSEPDRQKLISYLLYRGFDWDEINENLHGSEL